MNGSERFFSVLGSPIGDLTLVADDHALLEVSMEHPSARSGAGLRRDDRRLAEARRQLRAYFAGELREFRLSLALQGTPFQRRVWAGLQTIPYGETISYAELARRIGRPKAGRAVGGANHRNPIAIIVPCHRVIGADGTLVGYGGGLERKKTLLALEARVAALLKT